MAEFKGLTISPAIAEFGDGVPQTRVTEGNYLLECDGLIGSMTNDGDPFISFRAKIIDGPVGLPPSGAGLPIWTMCSFAEKREWSTGQMLNIVGIPVTQLIGQSWPAGPQGFEVFKKVCAALSGQVKGRKFGATVTDYTGGKTVTSQIARPFTADEFESQKAAAAAAAARTVAQPPTTPVANGTAPAVPTPAPQAPAPAVTDQQIQSDLAALLNQATAPTV